MKKLFKLLGLIAFVAVIGLSITACGGGGGNVPTDLQGDWGAFILTDSQLIEGDGTIYDVSVKDDTITIILNKSNKPTAKFSLSADKNTLTITNSEAGTILENGVYTRQI
jgi:hypothetical protein